MWKTTSSSRQMMEEIMRDQSTQHSASLAEASRVAQSALSATTEATTRLADGQLKWVETMWLGREEAELQNGNGKTPLQEENDEQPIPGIETLEGLPPTMREAIQREAAEARGEWKVLSQMPRTGSYEPFAVTEEVTDLPETWDGLPPEWNLSL
jgi:hypothetical protein